MVVLKQRRKNALDDVAIFQHVRNAGGHAQIVFQHVHRAVAAAHQVAATDIGPDAVARLNALAGLEVVFRAVDDLRGYDLVLENAALVVKVIDEHVQRGNALHQPCLDLVPFGTGHRARNDVQRPGPIDVVALGINGEADAHVDDRAVHGALTLDQLLRRQCTEILGKACRMRPRRTIPVDELVVKISGGVLC